MFVLKQVIVWNVGRVMHRYVQALFWWSGVADALLRSRTAWSSIYVSVRILQILNWLSLNICSFAVGYSDFNDLMRFANADFKSVEIMGNKRNNGKQMRLEKLLAENSCKLEYTEEGKLQMSTLLCL
jgi:hypothetical protein